LVLVFRANLDISSREPAEVSSPHLQALDACLNRISLRTSRTGSTHFWQIFFSDLLSRLQHFADYSTVHCDRSPCAQVPTHLMMLVRRNGRKKPAKP